MNVFFGLCSYVNRLQGFSRGNLVLCLVFTHAVLQDKHQEDAEFQSATATCLLVCELDQGHDVKVLKMRADA